jgi:CubicO group peptidase (beta-lactamase class C family)
MSRLLTAPTPLSLADGATLTAPAGWALGHIADGVRLDWPDGGFSVAVVQSPAVDADVAVGDAWRALGAVDERGPDAVTAGSPGNGWSEHREYAYATVGNERTVRVARARRNGGAWSVIVARAGIELLERRLVDFRIIVETLRAQGCVVESFRGRAAHRLDACRLAELITFVDGARKSAGIPGVALALAQDGEVIFAGGLGVRALGGTDLINGDTRFLIASNTKALTTLLLATLVDEGRLRWDTPVKEAHPRFRLGSADTTKRVQIRHLVSAATGMPRRDLEWLFDFEERSVDDRLRLLASMEPTTGFGEVFQYNNLLAAAAGFIAAHTLQPGSELGAAYDEAMRARIFAPLGMRSATFSFADALGSNHATPHAWNADGDTAIGAMSLNRAIVAVRPAGGAWASARDLLRYVQLELDGGRLPDGTRLVSAASLLERRRPQVAVSECETYGMGLVTSTQWGTPVVHHGGVLFGFTSDMFWLPEHGVGGVLLTNANAGSLLLAPFLRRTVELLFDGAAEAAGDFSTALAAARAHSQKERARLTIPPDDVAVRALAARYRSDRLGGLAVRRLGRDVHFDFAGWSSAVASRDNPDGSVSFVTITPGCAGFELVVGARAGRRTLVIRDAQHEYCFVEAEGR